MQFYHIIIIAVLALGLLAITVTYLVFILRTNLNKYYDHPATPPTRKRLRQSVRASLLAILRSASRRKND